MNDLVSKIRNCIQPYFEDTISMKAESYGGYKISSSNKSSAKDLRKDSFDDIEVVKWHYDYWLKMSFQFKKIDIDTEFKSGNSRIDRAVYEKKLSENNLKLDRNYYETFISISLFKGGYSANEKHQLFRAEWDNYATSQYTHPQPHWQFYQLDEYQKKLDEFLQDSFSPDSDDGFVKSLNKKFDFKRFHFAMCGNWINNETHVHSLNSEEKITKWLGGLLLHLKQQLDSMEKRR